MSIDTISSVSPSDTAICTADPADQALPPLSDVPPPLPDYLHRTYYWAYLSPLGRSLLDRSLVVSSILWGNANRLMDSAAQEFAPGQRVLQTACVYGDFSARLARQVGPTGRLIVADVAPIQIEYCRRKLTTYPQATAHLADAAGALPGKDHNGICCFFLLHEVPEDYKTRIVNNLLEQLPIGGKIVFVDYHRPRSWHPMKGIMWLVFRTLEPYASSLWDKEINSYAHHREQFRWNKQTFFGGLYQKVVAERISLS